MTLARAHLVDPALTRWYHCVTRCVRRAFLLRKVRSTAKNGSITGSRNLRKSSPYPSAASRSWIITCICSYALDPDVAKDWSDEEIVRRWGRLFPPRDKSREPLPVTQTWVQWRLQDPQWVATVRERLQSLSWFMKCLKEPLSRLANRQDKARGAFFEGRFKSVAILDDESLLATCAYIDLNPVAAGIAKVPEASPHTSITARVEHVKEQDRIPDLTAAKSGSIAGSNAAAGLEESIWLCPVEDRRKLDSSREGMLEGLSLGSYLLLVEYTGRLFRDGKAVISAQLTGIFERLGSTAETWWTRLEKLSKGHLLGRFFAASRARLRDVAARLGVHHLANLAGCPAR